METTNYPYVLIFKFDENLDNINARINQALRYYMPLEIKLDNVYYKTEYNKCYFYTNVGYYFCNEIEQHIKSELLELVRLDFDDLMYYNFEKKHMYNINNKKIDVIYDDKSEIICTELAHIKYQYYTFEFSCNNLLYHLEKNEKNIDDYMSMRILSSKLENSLFELALIRKLPKNIKVTGTYYKYSKFVSIEKQKQNEDKDKDEKNDEYHYENPEYTCENIRTYIKDDDESKHRHYKCSCCNNPLCQIDTTNLYGDAPAWNYNGEHVVNCMCEENIIKKLITNWEYIYELNNIDLIVHSIDDFGEWFTWHIVNKNNKITIHITNYFYSI